MHNYFAVSHRMWKKITEKKETSKLKANIYKNKRGDEELQK